MRIAVLGAGRAGTAVAVLLARAGHDIVAVSGREATRERAAAYLPGVRVLDAAGAARAAELVLVAVPDDQIAPVVDAVAAGGGFRAGQWVAHLSGATGLDALDAARAQGAARLGIHPLQTFPDVAGAVDVIPGCTVAVAADDDAGERLAFGIASDLGGVPFRLDEELRPLYHAAAVFASNYLVTTVGVGERLLEQAGVPDPRAAIGPLVRATAANLERLGPGEALTGPAVRGDAGTVRKHLETLAERAPDLVAAYVAMAGLALDLAQSSGRLTAEHRAAVDEVLAAWVPPVT